MVSAVRTKWWHYLLPDDLFIVMQLWLLETVEIWYTPPGWQITDDLRITEPESKRVRISMVPQQ
jgi:hypothetical protein